MCRPNTQCPGKSPVNPLIERFSDCQAGQFGWTTSPFQTHSMTFSWFQPTTSQWLMILCGLNYIYIFNFHQNTLKTHKTPYSEQIWSSNPSTAIFSLGSLLRLSLKLRHSKAKDQALPLGGRFNPKWLVWLWESMGNLFSIHQKYWAVLQLFPSSMKKTLQERLKKTVVQEKSQTSARSASTAAIPVIQLYKCLFRVVVSKIVRSPSG